MEDKSFIGVWHLVELQGMDPLELEASGRPVLEIREENQGKLIFGEFEGTIDHRLTSRGTHPACEFTWEGTQEGEIPVSGRGWVVHKEKDLVGILFVHGANEYPFIAESDQS